MGPSPAVLYFFLKTPWLVVRALGGWGKHIQICLRPSANRIVLRLGSPQGYGANGLRQLPFVEFPCGNANPKTSFPLFAFRRRGRGRSRAKKWKEVFWVCPRESASAAETHFSAIGAYEKLSS